MRARFRDDNCENDIGLPAPRYLRNCFQHLSEYSRLPVDHLPLLPGDTGALRRYYQCKNVDGETIEALEALSSLSSCNTPINVCHALERFGDKGARGDIDLLRIMGLCKYHSCAYPTCHDSQMTWELWELVTNA